MPDVWQSCSLFIDMKIENSKLEDIVKESFSFREVIRKCGVDVNSGAKYKHYKRKIESLKFDVSHFRGQGNNFGETHIGGCEKKMWKQVLVLRTTKTRERSFHLRRAFTEYCNENRIPIQCCKCGNTGTWLGKNLKLEISHIDDISYNNVPSNLEWNCPNCHAIK